MKVASSASSKGESQEEGPLPDSFWHRFWNRLPLGLRILLPFSLLMGIGFILANYLALQRLNSFQTIFVSQEKKIARQIKLFVENQGRFNLNLARFLAESAEVKETLANKSLLDVVLNNLSVRLSRDFPFRFRLYFKPTYEDYSASFWDLARSKGGVSVVGASPIHLGQKTVGFVVVSTDLRDIIDFLDHSLESNAGLYLLEGERLKPVKSLGVVSHASLASSILRSLDTEEGSFVARVDGDYFLVLPFRNDAHKVVAVYVKQLSAPVFAIARNLLKTNIVPTAILLVLSIIVSLVLIREIICIPLMNLNYQLRKLSSIIGKRLRESVRKSLLEIRGNDEIAKLGRTINNLIHELDELASFRQAIENDRRAKDIYLRLGRLFTEKFGVEEFVIFEVSNSENKMEVVLKHPDGLEGHCSATNPDDCRVCRSACRASSIHFAESCEGYENEERKYVCLPLRVGSRVIGVVHFLFPLETPEEEVMDIVDHLEAYLQEAAPMLEAKRFAESLRDISLRDTLTGLYNRRILDELLPQLASGAIRRGSNLGVVMLDIDHFKTLNDTYGHLFGDRVLAKVGHMIRNEIRESDLAVRFGGEEFLVVLVDAEPESSVEVAERIRRLVEKTTFVFEGQMAHVTISAGVAEFPTDDQNIWNVINFADLALYQAKRMGRNRTVRFNLHMLDEQENSLNGLY